MCVALCVVGWTGSREAGGRGEWKEESHGQRRLAGWARAGEGDMGTLYFVLHFSVNLKLLYKSKAYPGAWVARSRDRLRVSAQVVISGSQDRAIEPHAQ